MSVDRRTATLAALALTFNAFTWGVSWWPFRQMQGLGLHPLQLRFQPLQFGGRGPQRAQRGRIVGPRPPWRPR